MSHASTASASCPCGRTCQSERTLCEMMDTMESIARMQREDAFIAQIIMHVGHLARAFEEQFQQWYQAVTTCETGRANLALGSGTYLRPTVPVRHHVDTEERVQQRWLAEELTRWNKRLRQVQHGISTYRGHLGTLVSQWQLADASCVARCLAGIEAAIERRELLMESLSQTLFSTQEMDTRWTEHWKRESTRLDYERAQAPQVYQAGLEMGQQQRWSYVLTGIGRPISQSQLASQYALRVLDRQLELFSQQSRLYFQTARETWVLFLTRIETQSHLDVLATLVEQWYHLQATLEQPIPVDLAALQPLIASFFSL